MGKKKKKKAETVGVRSGLLGAIASLILFFALRYGMLVSLLFAVITGFSVGFILRWWNSTEGPRAKLHLFSNLKQDKPKKRYPGLQEAALRQSRRGSLNQNRQQKAPDSEPSGET